MIKPVEYPSWIRARGMTHSGRGYQGPWRIAGWDTETVRNLVVGGGDPYTLQVYTDDGGTMDYVTPANVLNTFVGRMNKWARERAVNVAFAHNLAFDLSVILKKHHSLFSGQRDFELDVPGGVMKCFCDKTWFARLIFSDHRLVLILDTFAYFHTSLARMVEMVGAPVRKLPRPAGLGLKKLTGPAFERYAMTDAIACYHVGKSIEGQHKQYDVPASFSAPHFASRVFRHHFINEGENIPFPPDPIARAASLSFHGGKNALPPWVRAGWVKDLTEFDLISAYSWSLFRLPPMTVGAWQTVREMPFGEDSILCASGISNCKYGSIFTHDFKPVRGPFTNVWTTGYEIESALRHGCLELKKVWGYVWQPASMARNPFDPYAMTMFKEKGKYPKGTIEYEFNKLLNNSLYGKTAQMTRAPLETASVTPDGAVARATVRYIASGLHTRVVAWCKRGGARARPHDFEEKYGSFHSSTDAIKAFGPADPHDLGGLGGLKVECRGNCLILGSKLYLHLDGDGKPAKMATSGFQAGRDVDVFMAAARSVLKGEDYNYVKLHCNSVRESLRRRDARALEFVDRNWRVRARLPVENRPGLKSTEVFA